MKKFKVYATISFEVETENQDGLVEADAVHDASVSTLPANVTIEGITEWEPT